MSDSVTVREADPLEWPAACRVLAACRPPHRREAQARAYLAALTRGTIDPAGLLVAADAAGAIHGAVLGQVLSGAVGLIWPPGTEAVSDPVTIEDMLVTAGTGWLRAAGVKVAQSLPLVGDRDGLPALERHGFRLVTQLALWRRDLAEVPPAAPARFEIVPATDVAAFAATLLATYEGSLDCPELVGDRTAAEQVAAHGLGSSDDRLLPFVARSGGEDVGVVLLAPADAPDGAELNYVGIVPDMRARGFGRELLAFAVARCAALGFRNLTLSVDVRNTPAVHLYGRLGFRPFEVRDVYGKSLSCGAGGI